MIALAAWGALVAGFAAPNECTTSYIVVGGGAAGTSMAAGLAKAGCMVTIVEKGPDDDYGSDNPSKAFALWTCAVRGEAASMWASASISTNPMGSL